MSFLTELDELKRELEERHPGWQVWFVPHSLNRTVTWCARPNPLLNEDSPAHLSEAILAAEGGELAGREVPVRITPRRTNEAQDQ